MSVRAGVVVFSSQGPRYLITLLRANSHARLWQSAELGHEGGVPVNTDRQPACNRKLQYFEDIVDMSIN